MTLLVLRKSISWDILASFLAILVKATCAGLKSFFSAKICLNTARTFSTTRKTFVWKAASKPQGGFFYFAVNFFN